MTSPSEKANSDTTDDTRINLGIMRLQDASNDIKGTMVDLPVTISTVDTREELMENLGEPEADGLYSVSRPHMTVEEQADTMQKDRGSWSRRFDFLLACVGFSVGLGNVWRFPYLCYKNGGGAFLVPYFIFVLFGGLPLFYLEVAVGQFMSRGGLQCWNIVPLMQGIGLAACIVVFYLNCYYNVILAWAFYFLFSSFSLEDVPWKSCSNDWNTATCDDNYRRNTTDPVNEFWERKVLGIHNSAGLHDLGELKLDLTGCLVFAWILIYCCICKGIKSSGKVMYVTATSPYIFMLILLIYNTTLDGASDGIVHYLNPDFSKLLEITPWVDAGTQIFFSTSIGLGTLTALGSYNKFNHNSLRDAVLFTCVNSGTSFFAGFIVFSILGFMAKQSGQDINDVATSGPGLAFVAYPAALAQLPAAPFWSVMFFLMVILLGMDSQFVGVEGVITTMMDQYPRLLHQGHRKEIAIAFLCIITMLIGMSMTTQGGMFVFQLFDNYTGGRTVLVVGFFEIITIAYMYGYRRFRDNLVMMVGNNAWAKIIPLFTYVWLVISPLWSLGIFALSIAQYKDLTFKTPTIDYTYPTWGVSVGWMMMLSSIVWIPIVAIYKYWKVAHRETSLPFQKAWKLLTVPYYLYPHQMRDEDLHEECLYDHEQYLLGNPVYPHTYEPEAFEKTNPWTIGYTGWEDVPYYNDSDASSTPSSTPVRSRSRRSHSPAPGGPSVSVASTNPPRDEPQTLASTNPHDEPRTLAALETGSHGVVAKEQVSKSSNMANPKKKKEETGIDIVWFNIRSMTPGLNTNTADNISNDDTNDK